MHPEFLKRFCVRQKQPPLPKDGKGEGEVRQGKVRAVDREVREEGKGK